MQPIERESEGKKERERESINKWVETSCTFREKQSTKNPKCFINDLKIKDKIMQREGAYDDY